MIYLGNNYIYTEVGKLIKRFKTRDPFELLDCMNIVVGETSNFKKLKGYCFMSCQTIYVMINSFLPDEEKRIDKAFRHYGQDPADEERFDSYVRGGIDVLYEKLVEGDSTPEAFANRLYEFIDEFNDRFNSEISSDDILQLCVNKS